MKTILFDMDGVLADFVCGSFRAHGNHTLRLPDATQYDYAHLLGFASAALPEFWAPMSHHDFWADLEPHDDGMELFRAVVDRHPKERTGFLSSGIVAGSADGKRTWVERHLPGWGKHLILGTAKGLLAAPCKVLVDDFDKNVDDFRAHGGVAVLIPRPWNSRRNACDSEGRFNVEGLAYEVREAAA